MNLLAQFILINAHFTINLLTALVCFAVSWLYFDAWQGRKSSKESTKSVGFLLLSLSYVIHSTTIDRNLITTSILGTDNANLISAFFKTSAYIILIIGQLIDPLQPLPEYRNKPKTNSAPILVFGFLSLAEAISYSFPILATITAWLYLRRATTGLEHHLKVISWSLFLFASSELLSLTAHFQNSNNIIISNLVAPFGPLWLLEHTLLILASFILGRWVWSYLVKRLETQLLMIFTTTTLMIFLTTTIFFTSTSINNVRTATLESLRINVHVLDYAIQAQRNTALSDAQVLAQDPNTITYTKDKSRSQLADLTTTYLLNKNQTYTVIVSDTGEVLARADEPDKVGGSLSDDPLVKSALRGEETSSIVTRDGTLAPTVSVEASSPIKQGDEIIGAVVIGNLIDSAFVDGLKDATGLEASIYADNVRSATTFIAEDGKTRWTGIKEETEAVQKTVLVEGQTYTGSVNILNVPYFTAFAPLSDLDENHVGMLFVGQPQSVLLDSASHTIELTFLITAALLILSVGPAYAISKYIINQIL